MSTAANEVQFTELKSDHNNLKDRVNEHGEAIDNLKNGYTAIREDIREIKTELRWIKWLLTVPVIQLAITIFRLVTGQ